MKKLYKSDKDKVFFGVLGGLGEYFNIDPSLLRVLFIFLVIFSGIFPGIVVYLLSALIIPQKPKIKKN